MPSFRNRSGVGAMNEAAARIRRLLEQEEAQQRQEQAEIERLRAAGWRPAGPAPGPSAGPGLADAARAIEARLDDEDAYREEARRRLAARSAPAEAAPGFGGAAVIPVAGETRAAPGAEDGSGGDWPKIADDIAERLGLDPGQVIAAGPDILPVLGGLFGYRHLDRQGQYEVMREIERWRDTHPQLYGAMRGKVADILVQPEWEPWSMSDEELRAAYEREKAVNDIFRWIGFYDLAAGAGLTTKFPEISGIGGSLGFGAYEGVKHAFDSAVRRMEKELRDRGFHVPE